MNEFNRWIKPAVKYFFYNAADFKIYDKKIKIHEFY